MASFRCKQIAEDNMSKLFLLILNLIVNIMIYKSNKFKLQFFPHSYLCSGGILASQNLCSKKGLTSIAVQVLRTKIALDCLLFAGQVTTTRPCVPPWVQMSQTLSPRYFQHASEAIKFCTQHTKSTLYI